MRTDIRQDSFSFVTQLDTLMSETQDTLIPVPQTVRDLAAAYAKRRNMSKGTIARYGAGGADEEPLLQVLAKTYIAGQRDPIPVVGDDELVLNSSENIAATNVISNDDSVVQENEQLKNQLADASGEIVVLKTEILDLKTSGSNAVAEANVRLISLVNKLVEAQTVIYNVRNRLKGSFFGKVSAIKELVANIDISNREGGELWSDKELADIDTRVEETLSRLKG